MTAVRRRMTLALALAASLSIVGGGCAVTPDPSRTPAPTPTVAPTPTATPAPTPTPAPAMTPAPVPDGMVVVPIPLAGISLPVPAAWEQAGADVLADEAGRADIVARHPGTEGLLEAAEQLGEWATPLLIALDPAPLATGAPVAPNIAVLIAQPAVSGPLLDFVAGFIGDGYREAFGAAEPDRERVMTLIGEAVRLSFEIPVDGGAPLRATAWVVSAETGTLLVSVIGPADEGPSSDPDALIGAAVPIP